jgi:hypothetical protein
VNMTSYTYADENNAESAQLRSRSLLNIDHGYGRPLWVFCTTVSLLSARYLLVEQNVHYPLQLYFNQLFVACLMILWRYRRSDDTQELFVERPKFWRPITWGAVMISLSLGFKSLSTICVLQAILHFQNLPTLVMMTVRVHTSHLP